MHCEKLQEVFKGEGDFAEVMASEKVLDIVGDLLGDPIGESIYYHSSKLMYKPAGGGRRKPWHQDWAYWQEMNTNQVTVWIAIDPATIENGLDKENIVIVEMNPGDALVFNVLALHASDPNNSPKNRLSAIIYFDSQPVLVLCKF